jgi:endonuclease G
MRAFLRYVFIAMVAVAPSAVQAQATRDNNLAMGNPSGATTSTSNSNNYLITKDMYTLSYNKANGSPNWVSWHLSSAWYGTAPRSSSFTASPYLPSTWSKVYQDTYTNSGFDRGHLCPSADRDKTSTENKVTFHGDNIMPQAADNNQGPWAKLETYCRAECDTGKEMYIIAGSSGTGGTGLNGYKTSWTGAKSGGGTMTVKVPQKTWKVILILPNGSSDVSRVTSSTRVIAVIMANDDNAMTKTTPWGGYRVKVRDVEALTGYNFFSALPTSVQDAIETKVDTGPTN